MEKNDKIVCTNIWKVFGPNEKTLLTNLDKNLSRSEVQEKTGHVVAVKDVSFSVQKGETFVVMGLSGSGKSTLVRCLSRLIEPTSGEVKIDNQDVTKMSNKDLTDLRRNRMSMVFQHFGLFPHRRVIENIGYGLEIRGVKKKDRLDKSMETLNLVGLEGWDQHYPRELSGGMQQRVGLARALATNPQILLMDEAFSALDPLIRSDMQNQLIELQSQLKKTIVFITHDLDESLRLGDHIGILNGGRLVQAGTPEQIIMNPADDYVEAFVKDVNRAKVLRAKTVMVKANEFNTNNIKLSEVYKVDESSYIEQFLPKVLSDRCTVMVVDKMGDTKGYITEKELAISLSKDGHNLK